MFETLLRILLIVVFAVVLSRICSYMIAPGSHPKECKLHDWGQNSCDNKLECKNCGLPGRVKNE